MSEQIKSVFETLNAINVNEYVEKKNGLNYLSWSFGWTEVKKRYPDATYTVYENELTTADGKFLINYFTDGKTCWVKTGVTINGLEHIEYLPVMDFKNKSIPFSQVTSFDVNKAIQRSLTKAIARHGLGLYIYAGEDLPEEEKPAVKGNAYVKPRDMALAKQIGELKTYALKLNIKIEDLLQAADKQSVEELTSEDVSKLMKKLVATEEYRKREQK